MLASLASAAIGPILTANIPTVPAAAARRMAAADASNAPHLCAGVPLNFVLAGTAQQASRYLAATSVSTPTGPIRVQMPPVKAAAGAAHSLTPSELLQRGVKDRSYASQTTSPTAPGMQRALQLESTAAAEEDHQLRPATAQQSKHARPIRVPIITPQTDAGGGPYQVVPRVHKQSASADLADVAPAAANAAASFTAGMVPAEADVSNQE